MQYASIALVAITLAMAIIIYCSEAVIARQLKRAAAISVINKRAKQSLSAASDSSGVSGANFPLFVYTLQCMEFIVISAPPFHDANSVYIAYIYRGQQLKRHKRDL